MKQSAPLSKSQLGIYAECVQHENEVFYNLPFLYVFDGSIDADRLCRAIEATIQAHPTFFTRIELNEEGEPIQTIDLDEVAGFKLQVVRQAQHQLSVEDLEAEKKKFIEPYQLYGGRLFHTQVMRDDEHVYWFFDMHHIISDGSSYHIIVCDVEKAYNGDTLAPEEMTMQEYALAEAEMRKTPAFEEAKQWYAQNFDCGDTFTQLMPDLEIPEQSDGQKFRTLATDMDRVDAFCKTHGIKKSTLFTSAYSFLLAKYNNEQESLFTTVFNGRTNPKFQHSVGMTVQTLPVYAKFTDDTTVLDYLKAGEEQMVGCRKHDIYSYTDIMNDLNLQTNSMFAWHGLILDFTELMGKPMKAIQLRKHNEGVSFYLMAFYVGRQYQIKAEYNANEYSETLIDQFLESYEAVLEGLLSQTLLRDIDICTENQRALLDSFNQTEVPYDDSQTIVSMFRRQVAKTPDNIAVVYQDKRFTYKELDEISDRIAAYIVSKGLGWEDVVSVLIPRCEWMPIVSLGVVKAGCAYQPLDPTYPAERLNFMMQDAGAKLLIADEELRPIVDQYQGDVLFTKDIMSLPAVSANLGGNPTPDSLFIMLYTSGTTGTPKGCQLVHRNLVAFCEWYHRRFNLTPDCKVTAYASYGFDANMMETYPCLTAGATLYIIPEELRLDLLALNEYFEKEHITHGFMTTQVAYQFATSVENHSLRYLLTGGEKLAPLTPPTDYTLVNLYGPTESTVCITSFDVTKPMKDIPIGAALDNVKLYIVDKAGHRLPVGVAGELWVAGPQVTRGYLNRPEKTAEVYIENPFDGDSGLSGYSGDSGKYSHIYRTGDIVRYLPDGNIQFVGRKDGQVKIRGFRIELKEVEGVILQFPGIKDATVQAFDEEGGGKFIAAYIVSDETVDIQALNNFIMEEKPPYMVPAVTMQIERIPLNQNQKVNKKALPKPEKKAAEAVVESNVPMNILEQEIHDIIAKIINSDDFGVTTPLGYAGLTSIMAIKLAIQINKRFGVTLDSKSLAKTGTLQSIENEILAKMMSGEVGEGTVKEENHADMSNIPLSYAQMGVYVECIKQPEATVYNIPMKVRFPKDVDTTLLTQALETLVKAHPQLQAHFGSSGSDIIQIIATDQPINISTSQHSKAEMEQYKHDFVKPFNLRQGPLYRMEIVTTEEWVYLLLDFHHLVMDGGSLDLLLTQLFDLLNGHEIEPETFTYADFVAAEKAAESSEEYAAARNFFQQRLGNVEGVTEVPSDLTNPKEQGVIETVTSPLDFDAVGDFCRQHNISPAHLTLAATFYALARFTNNEQLCITTISNGRSDLRIAGTTGMFVNTLALSATVGDQTVLEFLDETSRQFDETLRHEKYPFAQIATDYDLSAEIMFAYQMGVLNEHKYNGQTLAIESMESDTPKFRIAFYIQEEKGQPSVCLEYDNGRYSRELMQTLAQSVCNAAQAFIRQPELGLKQVSLLDDGQVALLDSFNQTDVPYDDTQTIVSLFRRQVELTPDNMAVVYHDNKYTYREVDAISERIAAYLISKGLGREDVVSVLIPRCEWMAIASLGVLKAGCAYQPLDPSYPAERLNFMMQDAGAKLLIADEALRPIVDEYHGPVLLTKDIMNLPTVSADLGGNLTPDTLFIMLYTSGSTGTPKGCQLEHRNLVAFCHWYQRHYGLTANDKVAAYASYGFDACMMDLYPALTCGACVHIIGDDIRLNLPDLNDYFNREGITHSFITTQVGYQFATNVENHSLRCFAVGGEKLSALNPPTNYKMYNGYGPTECTIFTTNYWVKDYELDIPIGKPLDNLKLYIVDKQFNRLPVGAMGELWVSGPQVSRGYLNRPEKTAETYIKNPFAGNSGQYSRIYRTGDIVRYLPDGNIQFVGRKDGQVKIRGFRIELKEVEAVIRQFPGIKDATVQAFDYENGGKYIAAYIVSDEKVDIKALNDFIGQQKPPYMIPAATMQIDAIPLNQNQKVNRKALPAPVIQAADHEYVEPANDTERLFCKIFAEILYSTPGGSPVGATDNFFELGGTSLMVTRVIIEADKAGHHIAYGDVFANPTPRLLSAFLTGGTIDEDEEARNHNYGPINRILEGNTLDAFRASEKTAGQPIGNALVTGATGFLGIHVLKELIDRNDVPTIWCMVRGESQEKAERRLKGLLFYYFNRNYKELFGTRLFVVNGDVTSDFTNTFTHLHNQTINTVFNCAAVVKHFSKGTEIEDVNVGGASHCVNFCIQNNARLIHISTYSTAGMSVNGMPPEDTVYTEQKLYFGQNLGNQYVHSKFLSERIVLDAIALHKLDAKVMRVGNLAPRSSDGEFQINFQTNSAMGRIRVYKMLGCYPYSLTSAPMEFSPIDEVAKAIVLLSETPKECCLFHPFNDHHVHFGDVLAELSKVATAPRQVEDEAFSEALEVAKQDPDKAKLLSSLIAYEDMAHGQKAVMIPTENKYTSQVLYRLGFRWSSTSWDYVDQMLETIAGLGFFDL